MTQQELEIKCGILEKRLNNIYEICNQYSDENNASRTIGKILANCDPDYIANDIKWHI